MHALSLHMHAFSYFVGPELFKRLSEDDTCTVIVNINWALKKKKIIMFTLFSSCYTITKKRTRNNTDLVVKMFLHFPLCSSEGSFETAQCYVIFLLVALPQVSLCRFARA